MSCNNEGNSRCNNNEFNLQNGDNRIRQAYREGYAAAYDDAFRTGFQDGFRAASGNDSGGCGCNTCGR